VAADAPAAFFSYCRDDSEFALRLAEDLKVAGAAVWMDQLDIEPGMRWDRAVETALNNCPRMRELRTLTGHADWVLAVAVTPDGQCAVSASGDQTLKVWDLASGRELRTLEGHAGAVWAVAVTPDGRRVVSASGDQTLKVWELGSGRELRTLTGHSDEVTAVAVTPDGQRAVSA
jgi:WD40 repeat protein